MWSRPLVDPVGQSDRSARRFRLLGLALAVFRLGPILILVGLIVAMSFLSPVFFTTENAGNVLSQTAVIAILAIGQLFVIITRGIDLSVGSNLALASVVGALAYQHGASGWVGDPRHARVGRRGRFGQRRLLRVGTTCPTRSSSRWQP